MSTPTAGMRAHEAAGQLGDSPFEFKSEAADERRWLLLVAAIAVAYLYMSLFSLSGAPYFRTGDESFLWTYACRLLTGQVFLKDFHQLTPPGADLLYAVVFQSFGISVRTINWIILCLGVALALATYGCARSVLSSSWAALAALVSVVLVYGDRMDATHHWFSSLANTFSPTTSSSLLSAPRGVARPPS